MTGGSWRTTGWWAGAVLATAVGLSAQETASPPEALRAFRAAVALQNQNLFDLAAEEWSGFLQQFPDDPLAAEGFYYQGVCHFQLQAYEAAEAAFEQALPRELSPELRPAALLNQGLAQFNRGLTGDDAARRRTLATLGKLVKEHPAASERPSAIFYLAETLVALQQPAKAAELYERGLEEYPQHELRPRMQYGLAVASQELGRQEQAARQLELMLKGTPPVELRDEAWARLGDAFLALGDVARAQTVYTRVATTETSTFADYGTLKVAVCHERQQRWDAAAQGYREMLARFPESPHAGFARVGVGRSLYLAGKSEEAETWCRAAGALPGDLALEAAHWLARAHLDRITAAGLPADRQVAEQLAAVLAMAGDSTARPPLELDLADIAYRLADSPGDLPQRYADIARRFPGDTVAVQAAYMAVFVCSERGDLAGARQFADVFMEQFGNSPLAADVEAIRAEVLLQENRFADARVIWERLIEQHRDRDERHHWIVRVALCWNRESRFDELVRWLAPRMAALEGELLGEAQYLLGSAYWEQGQIAKAAQLLDASLTTAPRGPQADRALYLRAQAHRRAGEWDRASDLFQRLVSEFPESTLRGRAPLDEAEMLFAAAKFDQARAGYQRALELLPAGVERAAALHGLAWSQINTGQFAEAVATLQQLVAEHPQHELSDKAHYAMGVAYREQDQPQAAREALGRFLEKNPSAALRLDAEFALGLCLVDLGQHAEAASQFERLLEAHPDSGHAAQWLYELAWARQASGQGDQAAKAFARLLERFPDSEMAAEARFRVAEHLYDQQQYDEAIRFYQQSPPGDSLAEQASHKLAWAYFQQGEFGLAGQSFERQLTSHPDGELAAVARIMLAECHFQQAQYEAALGRFTAELEGAVPPDQAAGGAQLQALARLHAGQAAAQLKKWPVSLRWLEECTQKYPASPYALEALYEQGWALQNLGRTEPAREVYQRVAESSTSPTGARARFMLGELLFADKQFDPAIRVFFQVAYGYGHPNSPVDYHVWQANALFEAARCCESTRRLDAAQKLYRELTEHYPQSDKYEAAGKKLQTLSAR